ncbi:hypothetical protein GCM10020254_17150 [Streptomyces goshikiensis]
MRGGESAYRMLTFAADKGQRAWLDESQNYGGTYLVGDRWVVVAASPDALAPLRKRIGGTVESGTSHGGASHGDASGSGTPRLRRSRPGRSRRRHPHEMHHDAGASDAPSEGPS